MKTKSGFSINFFLNPASCVAVKHRHPQIPIPPPVTAVVTATAGNKSVLFFIIITGQIHKFKMALEIHKQKIACPHRFDIGVEHRHIENCTFNTSIFCKCAIINF